MTPGYLAHRCGYLSIVIKKIFEQNSIRHRMLSGFLFLTALIAVVGAVSVYQFSNVNSITQSNRELHQLQVLTLLLFKIDNDFFDFESTNGRYFATRSSEYLIRRDSVHRELTEKSKRARVEAALHGYPFVPNLNRIDSLLQAYDQQFIRLEQLLFNRGFRDFGLEGRMRDHAHALESPGLGISLVEVLSLRRNEKDFLLRHDPVYVDRFNQVAEQLIQRQPHGGPKNEALRHLTAYRDLFNERVKLEREIGITSKDGVRFQLNALSAQVSTQYDTLMELASSLYVTIERRANAFYGVVAVAALFFSVLSGVWLSKRLSEPIARLSKLVNSATFDRSRVAGLKLKNAAIEITDLTESFIALISKINAQLAEIEQKTTQLKSQNEILNKLNRELDSFLYSAAHDLRAPFASMQGVIRLMRLENHQPVLLPYFELLQKSITRQEEFIRQIVSYARNKNQDVLPEPLALRDLVLAVFQDHEYVPGSDAVKKIVDVKEGPPFFSDRTRLSIILNNLVSNAIRYADPGKPDKFLLCRIRTHDGGASIEFSDNGLGISAEHLDKIFDMFYRASYDSKGSGLGLFIFREAIQKLGGFVTVESEPGIGTKFFIQLPNLSHQETIPWQPAAGLERVAAD